MTAICSDSLVAKQYILNEIIGYEKIVIVLRIAPLHRSMVDLNKARDREEDNHHLILYSR
jgi:hypothetical protein